MHVRGNVQANLFKTKKMLWDKTDESFFYDL